MGGLQENPEAFGHQHVIIFLPFCGRYQQLQVTGYDHCKESIRLVCHLPMLNMDCGLLGSSVHSILQAENTGVGCHLLLQGIFPTQGLNSGLLHCRQTLYPLSHQGLT